MDIEEGEHTSAGSLRTRGQERGRGTTTGRPRDRQDEKGRKIKGKVNENSRKQTPGRGRKEVRKRLDGPWHATEPKPRNQKRPRVDENGQRTRKSSPRAATWGRVGGPLCCAFSTRAPYLQLRPRQRPRPATTKTEPRSRKENEKERVT